MLRKIVLALAILLTIGGGIAVLIAGAAGAGTLIFGLLLLVGVLAERIYYKRLADRAPEPRFERTGERFRDPETGAVVQVYADPKTGERVYVRS